MSAPDEKSIDQFVSNMYTKGKKNSSNSNIIPVDVNTLNHNYKLPSNEIRSEDAKEAQSSLRKEHQHAEVDAEADYSKNKHSVTHKEEEQSAKSIHNLENAIPLQNIENDHQPLLTNNADDKAVKEDEDKAIQQEEISKQTRELYYQNNLNSSAVIQNAEVVDDQSPIKEKVNKEKHSPSRPEDKAASVNVISNEQIDAENDLIADALNDHDPDLDDKYNETFGLIVPI